MTQKQEGEVVMRESLPPEEQPGAGPRPIGTLMVIGILILVTIAFWMLVLGIQQGRA